MSANSVVTRFPPSPTGMLQAGNARTAVFNYLFARKEGGKFVLRIEDTDKERSKKEFEDAIIETVRWLGFPYDAFYRQSDNLPRHKEVLSQLIANGAAYISKETPTEEGQRSEVIRFKNPNTIVTFTDVIRGDISVDTTDLGDFVIARSMEEPLYHLGVVVDDADEGITHVIRGEDHISNTPRQILILRAMGASIPTYAHLPLVFGTDHKKLSKRTGAKPVLQYRDEGYLPQAIVNYLALLGWHPEDEQEIFTDIDELAQKFTLERIQKSSGIFDEVKLRWFNHEHMKLLSNEDFVERLCAFSHKDFDPRLAPLLKDRATTLKEAAELLEGEFDFFGTISYDASLLLNEGKVAAEAAQKHLTAVRDLLASINVESSIEHIKSSIMPYADEAGRGEVLWPLRVALSGKKRSPDPFTLIYLLGKEEVVFRIEKALQML